MMGSRLNFLRRIVAGKTLMLENNPPQLEYLDNFQAVGGKVWPASELMVTYLTSNNMTKNANILELGSGCGYVGIACAALGASHVTLTDRTITQRNLVHDAEGVLLEEEMPPNRLLLDICGRNIEENRPSIGNCSMDVQELQWGAENGTHLDTVLKSRTDTAPYNLIIGSDVTYHAELSESLFWTVSELMKRSAQRVDHASNISRHSAPGSAAAQGHENKLRFIVSHQHRLDSATALTLSTAKRFGLQCTTLATSNSSGTTHSSNLSSGMNVSTTAADSNEDASTSINVSVAVGGTCSNGGSKADSTDSNSSKENGSGSPAGEYVLWQFTL